jgi:hypothetical protein
MVGTRRKQNCVDCTPSIACTHMRFDGTRSVRSSKFACVACEFNGLEPDVRRHFHTLDAHAAASILQSKVARSFELENCHIVGVAGRMGEAGQAPGQLGEGQQLALHGTPTNDTIIEILMNGLKASAKTEKQWFGEGVYFSPHFRLSKKYNADGHRVMICAAIQEGQHSYHADDPTKRIHAAHKFEPYEGGVDCRVPGGVKSLGPATPNGDRYTSIQMGRGSWVNGKRRDPQIVLPPLNGRREVAADTNILLFYEPNPPDQYSYDRTFTAAERASHPPRAVRHGVQESAPKRQRVGGPDMIDLTGDSAPTAPTEPTVIGYHATNAEAAASIILTDRFKCGCKGLAGGGIYFATSAEHAARKSGHGDAVVLECELRLGRTLTLEREGDRSMTLHELNTMGFDSVKILRSGDEYVVYEPWRVSVVV